MVQNIHYRDFECSKSQVETLINNLSSENELLWPRDNWPAMKFDRPLVVGAKGGHGPIRYFVENYEPGRQVVFRFTGPRGFYGIHGFTVEEPESGTVRLQHEINMDTKGISRVSWPLVFRPMHDALIEDALDLAEKHVTSTIKKKREWSLWVRFLRKLLAPRKPKH